MTRDEGERSEEVALFQNGIQELEASLCATLDRPYGNAYSFLPGKIHHPEPGEALVRLDYSGICHGDLYSRDGGGPAPAQPQRPLIGGHEGIGVIITFGGKINNQMGFKSEYITFPLDQLIRIPHSLNPAATCPILCAGVTAFAAIRSLEPEPGKWCVVAGAAGGLGHLAIQYAKKVFGLNVLAIDGGNPGKEAFCKREGADEYVDFMDAGDDLVHIVREKTQGGADYVLVLSPIQSAYDAAGEYTRFRAKVMAVGVGNCHMPLRPMLRKDLTIRSHETGTKEDIEDALQHSASGLIRCRIEVLKLTDLNEALDRLKSGQVQGKLVLDLRS
ncbi:hypothetical protein LTR49_025579 [Elasticomyces elasticus]|nr:hypothetical protein LTR49_025579 [Elasticomyces elasticus]